VFKHVKRETTPKIKIELKSTLIQAIIVA